MADIKRTLNELLLDLADNDSFGITANDVRNLVKSVYGTEQINSISSNITLDENYTTIICEPIDDTVIITIPSPSSVDASGGSFEGKKYNFLNDTLFELSLTGPTLTSIILPGDNIQIESSGVNWVIYNKFNITTENTISNKLDKAQSEKQSVVSPVDFNGGILVGSGYFGATSPNIVFDSSSTSYIIDDPGESLSIQKSFNNDARAELTLSKSTSSDSVATLSSGSSDNSNGNLSSSNINLLSGSASTQAYQSFVLVNDMGGGIDSFIFAGSGLNIQNASDDGSAIRIPDGSWIMPQTAQQALFLTNGTNPSTVNSTLALYDGNIQISAGDGTTQFGSFEMSATNITLFHNSNRVFDITPTETTLYNSPFNPAFQVDSDYNWNYITARFTAGIDVLAPLPGGAAIKIPDGTWIQPQTENDTITITNGINPSDIYSNMTLSEGALQLKSGNGIKNHAYLHMFEDIITMGTNPTLGGGDTLNIGNGASQILVKGNQVGVFESNILLEFGDSNNQILLNDDGAYFSKGILIDGYRPDFPQGPTAIILPSTGMIGNQDLDGEIRIQQGPAYTGVGNFLRMNQFQVELSHGNGTQPLSSVRLGDFGIYSKLNNTAGEISSMTLAELNYDVVIRGANAVDNIGSFTINDLNTRLERDGLNTFVQLDDTALSLYSDASNGIQITSTSGVDINGVLQLNSVADETPTKTLGLNALDEVVEFDNIVGGGQVDSVVGGTDVVIDNTNPINPIINAPGISINATAIATNATDISTNSTNITTNATNITTNTSSISTNATAIATNATNITTNTSGIATNSTNIATNSTDISSNTSGISTNTSGIATNATAIATNATNIATNSTSIATNATAIGALDLQAITDVGSVTTNGATFGGSIKTNTSTNTINIGSTRLGADLSGVDFERGGASYFIFGSGGSSDEFIFTKATTGVANRILQLRNDKNVLVYNDLFVNDKIRQGGEPDTGEGIQGTSLGINGDATFGGIVNASRGYFQDAINNNFPLRVIEAPSATSTNIFMQGDGELGLLGVRANSTRRFNFRSETTTDSNFLLRLYDSAGANSKVMFSTDYATNTFESIATFKATDKILQGGVTDTGEGIQGTSIKSDGDVKADTFTLDGLNTAPTSQTDTGVIGEVRWDADYHYLCTATNFWKRTALDSTAW